MPVVALYAVYNRLTHSLDSCNKNIIHIYLRSDKIEQNKIFGLKLKSFSIYDKVLHCKKKLCIFFNISLSFYHLTISLSFKTYFYHLIISLSPKI